MKHTPGPWKTSAIATLVINEAGMTIANTDLVRRRNAGEQEIANARLIAAAPELLEAFREVGIQPGEIRLRANTLEDVFIALTGRRLRE